MNTTRRVFLKSGALALASIGLTPGLGPDFLRGTVFAAEPQRASKGTGGKKVMVCIFLRGAVDGLSVVVPHGDPAYYQLRQTGNGGIALPRNGEGAILDLDGHFGLHPSLAPLKPIYDKGHLAAIQAVGSPNATRSHFDAQDFMESATPGNKSTSTGWLTRVSEQCPEDQRHLSQIRTVALTGQLPRSLDGDSSALAIANLADFGVGKETMGAGRKNRLAMPVPTGSDATGGFESLYSNVVGDVLHGTGKETFDALKLLENIDPNKYSVSNGANYGNSKLGQSLKQIAQMIKAGVGLEIAFAEASGWDTHVAQGSSNGQLARRLGELGQALGAFWNDMGDGMNDVVVLTMSEFGRTARQNGDGGTDHGHGTCFLALGGDINGGQVLGDWPGLSPEQLYEGRDLAVTTDFRSVFGEVAARHMAVKDLNAVFPDYTVKTTDFRGLVRA